MKRFWFIFICCVCLAIAWGGVFYYKNLRGVAPAISPPVSDITEKLAPVIQPAENATSLPLHIPDGFRIAVFAKNIGKPRVLAWDPDGTLLVSVTSAGRVDALLDEDHDGVSEKTKIVISGLDRPHGLAFHNGSLFIAETGTVSSFTYDTKTKSVSGKKILFTLPTGGNHFTRTIAFGPDGRLYVSIGSSCNVCVEKDARRASILVADEDGSNLHTFARGLRNAVFFTWSPWDQKMWATNMGRDLLGDDIPPETVNIVESDQNYGWPYCYGNRIWDKTFDRTQKAEDFCKTTAVPFIEYQAHSAPLGLAFTPNSLRKEYRNSLLVAMHGSWNRTEPTGYKIVRFLLDSSGAYLGSEDFITGWLSDKGVLGRPVDLLFDNKGVLYISDDKAGVVYRLSQM